MEDSRPEWTDRVQLEDEGMRALAPVALTGLLTLILLEILKIIMEPLVAWLLGVLVLGLKISLALLALGIGIYLVRRYYRSRNEAEA